MASENITELQTDCEYTSKCKYAGACYCKGAEENQCAVLSVSPNLLEVNRVGRPHCASTIFFGFSTGFCRCIKKREELKKDN